MSKTVRFSTTFGPEAPELGWVPSPTHIIRRQAVLDLLGSVAPGTKVLEFGCGAGTLLAELGRAGCSGLGCDTSAPARAKAAEILRAAEVDTFRIGERPAEDQEGSFDLLIACEVLEHVIEDRAVARAWTRYLKPGGRMLVSVPAHRKRFGASDEWAGHVRRYEKADLASLIADAGLRLDHMICYGWPVTNILAPLSNHLGKRKMAAQKLNASEATMASGVDRRFEKALYPIYANPLSRLVFRATHALQRLAYNTDLGTGLLAITTKPKDSIGDHNELTN